MENKKTRIGFFILILIVAVFLLLKITAEKKEEPLEIGVSLYLAEDTFIEKILAGMEESAREYEERTGRKVVLNVSIANGSQRLQNEQVKRYVSLGYDAVCINLVDRTRASAIIDEVLAVQEDMPVVFFNREPVEEDVFRGEHIYYVGADAKASAILQGKAVVECLERYAGMDKNGDGILQYVMLEGEMGHQDTVMRSEYSRMTIEKAGVPLQKLEHGTADWQRGHAEVLMEQWIEVHGDDIELVLSNNDDMALGAADALEQAGMRAAIFGIDATDVGLAAVKEGKLWATVDCNGAAQGDMAFSIAADLAAEGKLSEKIPLVDQRYVRVPLKVHMMSELKNIKGISLSEKENFAVDD